MKKITMALGMALLLAGGFNQAQAQKSKKPLYTAPFAAQAYTYRFSWPHGVEATLDSIKALGITELEAGAPKGYTEEQFRKLANERGISIPGTGAGYEQIVKDPMSVVQKAKALGAKYVMVAWIPHEKNNFNIENAKKAVEDFNRVGKILKENGLTFAFHNHGYEFKPYGNGTLYDYIVENTNPEYVSLELDVLWAVHPGADPVKLLNKYGNRYKLMHLKDLKKGVKGDFSGGTPITNDVALGTGQIDIPAILKAAKKAGVEHYFIEDESPIQTQQVPQTIAYLKSLKE
ncbi:sugar phosphate isomerase/epimerase family protein [Telluribacter humicola]|uniref:sugar phosphate isomerase/epimerase family protein n=1 Tax=Telluribacter humicola TaxID=1720261 RepID=UPI001A956E0C|nr:sugar phosphate isomerase/epimerase [Telluribacter humicola]